MEVKINASERLIVALDFDSEKEALTLVNALGDTVCFYKIGYQLFLRTAMPFVEKLVQSGKKIFLDLKMGDIERTMRSALKSLPKGIEFVTIHGNGATAKAAIEGRNGQPKPLILSVTWLSSLDEVDLRDMLRADQVTLKDYVLYCASGALKAGCDGFVASGESVKQIREYFKNQNKSPRIIAPGIRPEGNEKNDHKRTLTPHQAIIDGADYLVVGRPVTQSPKPLDKSKSIILEIEKGLEYLESGHDYPISKTHSKPSALCGAR